MFTREILFGCISLSIEKKKSMGERDTSEVSAASVADLTRAHDAPVRSHRVCPTCSARPRSQRRRAYRLFSTGEGSARLPRSNSLSFPIHLTTTHHNARLTTPPSLTACTTTPPPILTDGGARCERGRTPSVAAAAPTPVNCAQAKVTMHRLVTMRHVTVIIIFVTSDAPNRGQVMDLKVGRGVIFFKSPH